MSDKGIKAIQEIQELTKTLSKDGTDQETKDAKIAHLLEKLKHLKQERKRDEENHKRQLKEKDREIRKLIKKQKEAQQKLKETKDNLKMSRIKSKPSEVHHACDFNEDCHCLTKKNIELDRQIQKKIEAQEKLKKSKEQNEELKAKLADSQQKIKKLEQENQDYKILLEAALKDSSQTTSQPKESDDSQNEMSDSQRVEPCRHGIMDVSEGRAKAKKFEEQWEQPLKPAQDIQTDDQQQDQPQGQYESDSEGKSSKRIGKEKQPQISNVQDYDNEEIKQELEADQPTSPMIKSVKSVTISECSQKIEQNGYFSDNYQNNSPVELTPQAKTKPEEQKVQKTNSQGRFSWLKHWVFKSKK